MSKRAPGKMGPRQVQYWKSPAPRFASVNNGIKKGGSGPKKIK